EFDAKFQQANAEQTALDQQAPFVRTNPVSITKGILGSQVPITAPGVNEGEPIYSERKQIALWGGDDAETTAVTCCFGPVGHPGVTAQSGVQPVGIVKWGTRGFLMEAEIDILLGAQFTVCASYVVLEGMMAGPAGAANTFNFTGMVSTAPCVRTAPLTRTLYWNILAGAANTGYLRIPAFAKNLIIFRTGAVVGDFTISIADLAESEIYRHIVSAAANMTIPLPLAGSAATFRVTNNSGTNGDYVFIFELGL
ncbi:MAG: hypothetical protein Q7R30_23855, partial [Acidobacteriota bacterium]|nr:hypothetical protein [Acidobacteriota bacterium]